MKTIITLFLTLLFIISYGQEPIKEKVIEKLLKDKIAYKQFRYYGGLHCMDKSLDQDGNLLIYGYGAAYNSFYPFPRLIDIKALKKYYNKYEVLKRNKKDKNINQLEKCFKMYKKNRLLKHLYIKLIKDNSSYYSSEDSESYMNDYLENYYIKTN